MELTETKHKQTEVGLIPNDWHIVKLCETLFKGVLPSGLYKDKELYGRGSKIIKLGDVFAYDYYLPQFAQRVQISTDELNAYKVNEGDLIVALASVKLEGVGKVLIVDKVDEPTVYDHNVALIRLDKGYHTQYFGYVFKSSFIRLQVSSNATQVGTTFLKASSLKKFNIPIPPTLDEQKAIAIALSDIDALIANLEKLITKKKAIKQGAMQQLLTPPNKGGKRLAGFTGDWEEKSLGEIADIIGGGTPSSFISSYWNGTINWFTPTEIGASKYTFESVRKITKEGYINCSGKMLPIGTILLTTRAGIGDLSILMREGCTNQGFQSLIVKKGYFNEYLYYLMQTLKTVLIQNASGSTFLEISPNKIKQIEISIPSLPEQTSIATILSDMDFEIERLQSKKSKYEAIKQGMMQELLTGKTRLV